MSEILTGKVVLVTGGAKRVGAAICRRLHAQGANLMLHYRASVAEARALQHELNAQRADSVALIQADLLNSASLPDLVKTTATASSAGSTSWSTTRRVFFRPRSARSPRRSWDDLIGTNLKAPLFLSQAAAPRIAQAPRLHRQYRRHPRRVSDEELRRLHASPRAGCWR